MLRIVLLIAFTLGLGEHVYSQSNDEREKYAASISEDDLKKRLQIIASDEFEGRETGQEGQKKAANYIRDEFASFGYGPIDRIGGYFQPFKLQGSQMPNPFPFHQPSRQRRQRRRIRHNQHRHTMQIRQRRPTRRAKIRNRFPR